MIAKIRETMLSIVWLDWCESKGDLTCPFVIPPTFSKECIAVAKQQGMVAASSKVKSSGSLTASELGRTSLSVMEP